MSSAPNIDPQASESWLNSFASSILNKIKSSKKDGWDKTAILMPVVTSVAIAIAGWWFTSAYQTSQLDYMQAELMHKFLPDIEAGGPKRAAAIVALSKLGYEEIALELAEIYGSSETADAVTKLGMNASSATDRLRYFQAYQRILEGSPKLSVVGEPTSADFEEIKQTSYASEMKTKTYTVVKSVPQTKTRRVAVTKYRSETRMKEVPQVDPRTGKPLLDDNGKPVVKAEDYTVQVPYTEDVLQSFTVMVQVPEEKTVQYTVQVPHTETVVRTVNVYADNFDRTSKLIEEMVQTGKFASKGVLVDEIAKHLNATSKQRDSLKRQVDWQTTRDRSSGLLQFIPLPEPLELPTEIREPVSSNFGLDAPFSGNLLAPEAPQPSAGQSNNGFPVVFVYKAKGAGNHAVRL